MKKLFTQFFKQLFIGMVVFIFCVPVNAKKVETIDATSVAQFLVEQKFDAPLRGDNLTLVYTATNTKAPNAPALYYVFNVGSKQGFIIVSADDMARPILGYGTEGSYDHENLPPNFAAWMEDIGNAIAHGINVKLTADDPIQQEWEAYLNRDAGYFEQKGGAKGVSQLLTTTWNQSAPYNKMCPLCGTTPTYTGCVATATAQMMKYYNYPAVGTGTSTTYKPGNCSSITVPAVPFNVYYDWANMGGATPNTFQEDNVAVLMYHIGAGVQMNYGTSGSGAISANVGTLITTHFGYDKSLLYEHRAYYTDTEWMDLLKQELDAGRPLYYSGRTTGGDGHAFICDGYDGDLFHFNWGWGGSANAYYTVNPMPTTPTIPPYCFSEENAVYTGWKPDEGGEAMYKINLLSGTGITSPSSVQRLTNFTVIANFLNAGTGAFPGGLLAFGLFDASDDFIVIGTYNISTPLLPSGYTYPNITCNIPFSVTPGNYIIKPMIKATGTDDWVIVKGVIVNGISLGEFPLEVLPPPAQCLIPVSLIEESFDDTTFPPECWYNISTTGHIWNRVTEAATGYPYDMVTHSGEGMIYYNGWMYPVGARGLLISPQIATNNRNSTLTFWMYRENANSGDRDRVNIYVSETQSITGLSAVDSVHRYYSYYPPITYANIGWNQFTINLPTASMSTAYVIFEGVAERVNFYLDDITIEVEQTPYTVTFATGGFGIADFDELTETSAGEGITLPNVTMTELCDLSGYAFYGWAEEAIDENDPLPTVFFAGNTFKPEENMTLTAVYVKGSAAYQRVQENMTDWEGDYLIAAFSNRFFDGSRGTADIDAESNYVDPEMNLIGSTISKEWGDDYKFTLEAVAGGYVMKSAGGAYIYRTASSNGLNSTTNKATATPYPISVNFVSSNQIDFVSNVSPILRWNNQNTSGNYRFRFYTSAQTFIYAYKLAGDFIYTSTPDCTPDPDLTVEPSAVPFGNVLIGGTGATETVAVEGNGYLTENIGYSLSGTNADAFSVTEEPDWTAAAGGHLAITFTPTETGAHIAYLTISSSGIDKVVPLSGTGVKPTINTPASLTFNNIEVGTEAEQTIAVTSSYLSENITYTITGDDPDFFAVEPDLDWTGEAGTLIITFSPDEEKTYTATLNLSSEGADTKTVNLTGYGVKTIIAKWNDYAPENPRTTTIFLATGGIAANDNTAVLTRDATITANSNYMVYVDRLAASTGWANAATNEKYWVTSFSTVDYGNLTVTSKQQSPASGPRDFKIQYSLTGASDSWTDVENGVMPTLTSGNLILGADNLPLPAAMANKATVYLRWLCTSNTSANGGTTADGVANRIDIVIFGEPFTGNLAVEMPELPASGTFYTPQEITMTCATEGATIYYTTTGDTPTDASTPYDGTPVTLYQTTTVKAIAVKEGMDDSEVAVRNYTIRVANPVFAPPAGIFNAPVTVLITCATPDASIYYTTNGDEPTTASLLYTGTPFTVPATTLVKAIAVKEYMTDSEVTEAAYTILTKPDVMISGVYGGGGNGGAPYNKDYIELFNNTEAPINLEGYTLYYGAAAGNFNNTNSLTFPEGAVIEAKSFMLIAADGGATGADLPDPCFTHPANLSGTAGKVLLLSENIGTVTNPSNMAGIAAIPGYVDYVPYGTTAVPVFGTATANLSNTTAAHRKYNEGTMQYTFNVGDDFTVGAPNPKGGCPFIGDPTLYIITGAGESFTAKKAGITIGTPNTTIYNVINNIMINADGEDCAIQLGNGADFLNIGVEKIEFNGGVSNDAWGLITLTGKLENSHNTAINLINGVSMTCSADINQTDYANYAISNGGTGTLAITGGTITTEGMYAVNNQSSGDVIITDGTFSAETQAVLNYADGKITISGGNFSAINSTIFNNSTGNIEITGGEITTVAPSGNAIWNESTGNILLGGAPIIPSTIYQASTGKTVVIYDRSVNFNPGATVYTLNFGTYIPGGIAVKNGAGFLSNFELTNPDYKLLEEGDDIVIGQDAPTVYIITGSGTSFTARKAGVIVPGAENTAIQTVINAIKAHAEGDNCTIQFGSGGANELNIGSETFEFNNGDDGWGDITLTGKIAGANSGNYGVVHLVGDRLNVECNADITKTGSYAITTGIVTGVLEISAGTITATSSTIYGNGNSTLRVTGGTVNATGSTGKAIDANGGLGVYIFGGTVSAPNNTVYFYSPSTLNLSGGTIEATEEPTGIAVYVDTPIAHILMGNAPTITGAIYRNAAGYVELFNPFAPNANTYTIDFATYTVGATAVQNGAPFLSNFILANIGYKLEVAGAHLVIAQNADADVYIITGSGTTFTARKNGLLVGTMNVPIQRAIDSVRTHAKGADCIIRFGAGGDEVLNIGNESAEFNGLRINPSWGHITLTGKLEKPSTGTTAPIVLNNGVSVEIKADITRLTSTAVNASSNGTLLTISAGTISSTSGTALNIVDATVNITGGMLEAGSYYVVYVSGTGTLNMSGGTISGTNTNTECIRNYGGTVNISGGTVVSTYRAITNHSSLGGTINVSGGTVKTTSTSNPAIQNPSTNGRIYISGNALITSGNTGTNTGTILLDNAGGFVVEPCLTITGGTIENTAGTYAIYDASSGSILLGGNPTITGVIYKNKLDANIDLTVITEDVNKFAPTSEKRYTLDFASNCYSQNKLVVIDGAGFVENFEVVNPLFGLKELENDLVLDELIAPYIITGSGTTFTATKLGVTIGTANQSIPTVMSAIYTHSHAAPCTIQFGNNGEVLNIGTERISFSTGWGHITLTGKLTSAITSNGMIQLSNGVSVDCKADIIKTAGNGAISLSSASILTVSAGSISASTDVISNTSGGTVTVTGGVITATDPTGNAINSTGAGNIILGNAPDITGRIRKGGTGNINVITDGVNAFNPTTQRYTLDYATYTPNALAVTDGAPFIENFEMASPLFKLTASDNDLVMEKLPGIYIITREGSIYTATKLGAVITTHSIIQTLILNVRTHAAGEDCIIQFGSGGDDVLDIGTATISFYGTAWGHITLLGKITAATTGISTGMINIGSDIVVDCKADVIKLTNGSTLYVNGNGTLTISGGTITGLDRTVYNAFATGTINITGGVIEATSPTGIAVYNFSIGRINISGDAVITSGNTSATGGTVYLYNNNSSSATRLQITGGTIINTAGGNAILNASTGGILLGGDPDITGKIRKNGAGNLTVITDGDDAFAPTNSQIYTLDFAAHAHGALAVIDGAPFIENFEMATPLYKLAELENNLIMESVIDIYIITGSGTIFTATKADVAIPNGNNVGFGNAITAIKADALGNDCFIQFGDGIEVLNVGTANANFDGSGTSDWGYITLLGKITAASNTSWGTISFSNGVSADIKADIARTSSGNAVYFNSTGTLDISAGNITSSGNTVNNVTTGTVNITGGMIETTTGNAVYNSSTGIINITGGIVEATTGNVVNNYSTGTVNISGGIVEATTGNAVNNYSTGIINISGGIVEATATSGRAVYNNNTGKITISGDADITSANESATNGTIFIANSGTATAPRLEITGGTITNTVATGNAVINASTGSVLLGNAPDINGRIRKQSSGNLAVITEGADTFAPEEQIYLLDFVTYASGIIAVKEGADFLESFDLVPHGTFILATRNDDIVLLDNAHLVTVIGGTGSGIYGAGETITITANAPAEGYYFAGWQVNSGTITLADDEATSTTFIMPATDVTVTAKFEEIPSTFTITATASPTYGGAVTGNTGEHPAGTPISLTATANPCFAFEKWTKANGDFVSNESLIEFDAVANLDLVAHFQYTCTPSVYVITGSGTTFTAMKDGAVISANKPIQNVINDIREHADGTNCTIQFGAGGDNVLDISSASVEFNDAAPYTWGYIILIGKLTSAYSSKPVVTLTNGISMESRADIDASLGYGIKNEGTGTLTISEGTISSLMRTLYNSSTGTITVNGGTITVAAETAACMAIYNESTGTVNINAGTIAGNELACAIMNNLGTTNITGGTISTTRYRAIRNVNIGIVNISGGTITAPDITIDNGYGNIIITGGEIIATGSIAISYESSGNILLGNAPNITGYIYKNGTGNLSIITEGTNIFAPEEKIYLLGFSTSANGVIAVKDGAGFLANFALVNPGAYVLVERGDDIILLNNPHTVTVNNGTGGGVYGVGETVTITANAPEEGYYFAGWQVVSGGVTLANNEATPTTFLMEDSNVEVTAVFELIQLFCGGDGSFEAPYLICNAAALDAVREKLLQPNVQHFKLTQDIDLEPYLAEGGAGYAKWGEDGWSPIGSQSIPFKDVFDGDGYEITGLWINRPSEDYQALIGYTKNVGSAIRNLGVHIASEGITGNQYVAGIAGDVSNTVITNCYVTGGKVSAELYAGGIAGRLTSATISYCYTNCNVSVANTIGCQMAGGIAADIQNASLITDCYTTGNISGNITIGGIAGRIQHDNTKVLRCYATGNVSGNATQIGGIVGLSVNTLILTGNPKIDSCFAFNSRLTLPNIATLGRILGRNDNSATLLNNYAWDQMLLNTISPTPNIFIGTPDPADKNGGNITACEAVFKGKSAPADVYTNWDFDGVWTFDYANYNVETETDTTNLPILSVFNKTKFKNAVQIPHLEIPESDYVTPTFTLPTTYCVDDEQLLPGTSTNGITGHWENSGGTTVIAINTTVSVTDAVYTFKPNTDQCAIDTTLSVTVTANVTPTFTFGATLEYCIDATPTTLPTTSNNGITGSWLPTAIVTSEVGTETYTFTPTTGSCVIGTGTVSVEVTVNDNPTPAFDFGATLTYCQNATPITLPTTSVNGVTGSWSPTAIITATPTGTEPDVYTFTPAEEECADQTVELSVTVTANVTPTFTFGATLEYCIDATPTTLPTTSNNGITGSWSPTAIVTSEVGTKTYTFTPATGSCVIGTGTVSVEVTVTAKTTPSFSLLTTYCVGASQELPETSTNGIVGHWEYPVGITVTAINTGTPITDAVYTFKPNTDQCAIDATLSVTVKLPPTITTISLPNGTVDMAYSQNLATTGDIPITWSIESGALPTGLSLDPASGVISGTPTAAATFNFTVKASNDVGNDTKPFSITIILPTFTIKATASANGTITPNGTVSVDKGSNQAFDIMPNSGCTVYQLIVDGTIITGYTTGGTYTFTNVNENHYIVVTFISGSSPCPTHVADLDGNIYSITELAGSCWFRENLRSRLYQNGTEIVDVMAYKHHFYPDEELNEETFGLLYTNDAVTGGLLCPAGWRLPKTDEWMGLSATYPASELRNPAYWLQPNTNTNTTNFNCRGAGFYNNEEKRFENILGLTMYWTVDLNPASVVRLVANYLEFRLGYAIEDGDAISVRCILDEQR